MTDSYCAACPVTKNGTSETYFVGIRNTSGVHSELDADHPDPVQWRGGGLRSCVTCLPSSGSECWETLATGTGGARDGQHSMQRPVLTRWCREWSPHSLHCRMGTTRNCEVVAPSATHWHGRSHHRLEDVASAGFLRRCACRRQGQGSA